MNTRSRPHVPRNDFTSVRLPQGGQSRIFCTVVSSATLPSYVQQCPTTTADGAQAVNFFPLNVPPYAFTLCNTRLRLLRCSQTNLLIPGFPGIVSTIPSSNSYRVSGPFNGTSSTNDSVMWGISFCRINTISPCMI